MCGITGLIAFQQQNPQESTQWLRTMTRTIAHRGPDGEGIFEKNVPCFTGLGHRRLSILDTSEAGAQPMSSHCQRFILTFNGEIYNYIELREELKQLGHSFRTGTDTEVLLCGWATWGRDLLLNKLNGMFALGMIDQHEHTLTIARDRTGVKPLCYFKNNEYFAFASEAKALLTLPFVSGETNPNTLFDFLVFHQNDEATHNEEGWYEGWFEQIKELLPGYSMTIDLQRSKTHSHKWAQPLSYTHNNGNEVQELAQLFEQAIRLRLRSDVPVGSCLSGGLDSSAIVCQASKLLTQTEAQHAQNVFTAAYHETQYDESKWAQQVVAQTNTTWHKTFPDAEGFAKELEILHYCQDAPTLSSRTYAQFRVMALAKEHGIKVLLDGQGGDELFGGYAHHVVAKQLEMLKSFHLCQYFAETHGSGFGLLAKEFVKKNVLPRLPYNTQWAIKQRTNQELKYLQKDFVDRQLHRFEHMLAHKLQSLNQTLDFEINNGPLRHLLRCEDRCGMWHGVETRTPFADDLNLIAFAEQLPSHFKVRQNERKWILREASKGLIPEAVRNRQDKMGFNTPNNEWIRQSQASWLHHFDNLENNFLDTKAMVRDAKTLFNPSEKTENFRLYKFISYAVWRNVFNNGIATQH